MDFCNAVIQWAHKCSDISRDMSEKVDNPEYKANLEHLAVSLKKVPEYPANTFYEAVLSLYINYPFLPDSIGLIDRYLYPYFQKDIGNGILTIEKASEYLQELFLMLQARINIKSDRFYRGGASHFCIGGYLENGEDGFQELSKLILDSLMDLPTCILQISLRWTEKTPREVFEYVLNCERNDKKKRIAFVNDEPRIRGLMQYQNLSYKEAVNYTMMGCNELALPGGIVYGFDALNILRSVENTLYHRSSDIVNARSYEEFFFIYQQELWKDLDSANKIGAGLQQIRSRDCHIVSNIYMNGCIESGRSITQGGSSKYIAIGLLIGIPNVIDSLTVIKQFVYDEKRITMSTLLEALQQNWKGYEDLHNMVMKRATFFGNDDERSNSIAREFLHAVYKWNDGTNYLHKKWLFGNLIGYNEHNLFFGKAMKATPDGRYAGERTSFGIGQSDGKDRNGLTALLNSIAKCDPDCILTGPSVTNLMLDERMICNEDSFQKLIPLFETYFKNGRTHFQLTYVSKEDLISAKNNPKKYRSLRVRVSGFSDFFVNLNTALQEEIIDRTVQL